MSGNPSAAARALDPTTPAEDLVELHKTSELRVRSLVLANPSTPPAFLVAAHPTASSRERVALALNPNSPTELLDKLAHDSDWYVRWNLTQRGDVPSTVLEALTYDEDDTILHALVDHPYLDYTENVNGRYASLYAPEELERLTRGHDQEAVTCLASAWSGSIKDLKEAVQLTQRRA